MRRSLMPSVAIHKPGFDRRQSCAHAAVVDVAATLMRMPPISAAFSANDVSDAGPVDVRATSATTLAAQIVRQRHRALDARRVSIAIEPHQPLEAAPASPDAPRCAPR